MAQSILIIEDEEDLIAPLEYSLQQEGYEVRTATTGHGGIQKAKEAPHPNLILLDIMLPDIPGTQVCRQLRADPGLGNTKIIMLTAKGEEIDRVVGFELGADDYVVKPYSMRELLLRIRAVLRRSETASAESIDENDVQYGRLRVDASGHRAFVDGEELTLTALEFKLLRIMVERRGRVQTREVLLSDVWGIQADITTRTVDTHVKRLRQKLGPVSHYVQTQRGVGYRCPSKPEDPQA